MALVVRTYLGGQQMQNNLANYGMLTSAGGLQEQQQQNDINAQIAKFQQAWQVPATTATGEIDGVVARHDALQYGDVGEFAGVDDRADA